MNSYNAQPTTYNLQHLQRLYNVTTYSVNKLEKKPNSIKKSKLKKIKNKTKEIAILPFGPWNKGNILATSVDLSVRGKNLEQDAIT